MDKVLPLIAGFRSKPGQFSGKYILEVSLILLS